MPKLEALKKDSLMEAPANPGVIRHLAFQGDGYLVLHASSEPGRVSRWHHHGDYDVYGYVASGSARFESSKEMSEAISLSQGDFFHIAPHTVHREINPSSEMGNEIILFFRGTGPMAYEVEEQL